MNNNSDILYRKLIEKSWNDNIEDYMSITFDLATELENDSKKAFNLVDKVLKMMLSNLKNNVDEDLYDNIIFNLGKYSNQDAYDFTIGVIKTYYINEFKINNNEYRVFDIFNTIVEQYKTKDTPPIPEVFHYMLACLYRLHYALYIKRQEQK